MLQIEGLPGGGRFSVRGELDAATADQLVAAVGGSDGHLGDVILETSGLTFCDSTGLRALLQIAKGLTGQGTLVLQNPTSSIKRLLALTGVEGKANLRTE